MNDEIDVNRRIITNTYGQIESKMILHIIIEKRNKQFLSKLLEKGKSININEYQMIESKDEVILESKTQAYMAFADKQYDIVDVLLSNENIDIIWEKSESQMIETNISFSS